MATVDPVQLAKTPRRIVHDWDLWYDTYDNRELKLGDGPGLFSLVCSLNSRFIVDTHTFIRYSKHFVRKLDYRNPDLILDQDDRPVVTVDLAGSESDWICLIKAIYDPL